MNKNIRLLMLPSIALFVLITVVFAVLRPFWTSLGVRYEVVIGSNVLLFLLSALTSRMHLAAIKNPNPNVFSNSIMGGTMIKMFVLGAAVVIYLLLAGKSRNVAGIFIGMFLYVLYTVIDVRNALQLNKKP